MGNVDMKINSQQTKTIIISKTEVKYKLEVEEEILEQGNKFKYLRTMISQDGRLDEAIKERTGAAVRLFRSTKTTFLAKNEIPKGTNVYGFEKVATSILTYEAATWFKIQSVGYLRKIEGKNWDKTDSSHNRRRAVTYVWTCNQEERR